MGTRTIHPFPAKMAPDIALDAIPAREGSGILTVVDPMCGSGTVLSAAIRRGQRAIGVDIDPLAVLMSRVATAPLDTSVFLIQSEAVCATAKRRDGVPPWTDEETGRFVDFWFARAQERDLIAISSAIMAVPDEGVRAALSVALSRIIITKAPQASLAADTSHSRPHRVTTRSEYDVIEGFRVSARSLKRLLDARSASGVATVKQGDSRVLSGVASGTADLIVTSPPYLNALDYMRGHKFALVWLGYSIPHLRSLRGKSIGAERAPDVPSSSRAKGLVALIKEDVAEPDRLPLGTVQRFADDMTGFASAVQRVMKADGKLVMVVGNSTLRGNYIRNDLVAQLALEAEGFVLRSRTERDIPATHRYLAINTKSDASALRQRMRSEVVLTMNMAS